VVIDSQILSGIGNKAPKEKKGFEDFQTISEDKDICNLPKEKVRAIILVKLVQLLKLKDDG